MKKIIIFMAITLFAFAETVSVDLDFLLKSHPKLKTVQSELGKEKIKLEKDLNSKADKLKLEYDALVKKGNSVTEAEKQAFSKKDKELSEQFSKSQNNLALLEKNKIEALISEIKTVINNHAKTKKYTLVLDKKTAYYGARDITSEIEKLIKK